jgi:diguanylate cyclase
VRRAGRSLHLHGREGDAFRVRTTQLRGRGRPSSRAALVAVVGCAVAFATGIGSAPHAGLGAVVYDLLLFNAVPAAAAVSCLRTARRVPEDRIAWRGAAVAFLLSVAGNVLFALTAAALPEPPFPSIADIPWLASYPALYVVAVALVVGRVRHLRPSTWLDGLIGALGITSVAATLFIAPAVQSHDLGALATVANYAYPVADVLLLALLGAVLGVLGLRADKVIVLLCVVLGSKLLGDVLLAAAQAGDGYVIGGPLDLTWMANAVVACVAARAARPSPAAGRAPTPTSRRGWRVVVIPLACNAAALSVLAAEWGEGTLSVGGGCALGCLVASMARTAVTFRETRALDEVSRQASTDELTGLPNRRALLALAEWQLARSGPTALLLLDLDGFKAVNDGLGHAAGDELLRRLGHLLRPALRPCDVLARLGGDEFAVLLPGADAAAAAECAQRLHALVRQPVVLRGSTVRVGASIGVATAPGSARTTTDLLQQADAAMYAAKADRGGVGVHAPEPDGPAPGLLSSDRAGGIRDLPVRFRLLTADDGRPALVETVATASPDGTPDHLHEVLRAVTGWWAGAPVPVRVRLGAGDLTDPRLADRVGAALLRHALPPESLEVCLESGLLQVSTHAVDVLHALRERGIRTAVDGVGFGALTLHARHDLPADRIQLDRTLVAAVATDRRAALVAEHTVSLARALGHTVVAEATSDPAAVILAELGCEVLEDPAPGTAVPAAELATGLRTGTALASAPA